MILLGHKKLDGMKFGGWVLQRPTMTRWSSLRRDSLQIEVHDTLGYTTGVIHIEDIGSGIIRLHFSGHRGGKLKSNEILTPIGEIRTLQGVQTCIKALLLGVLNK
jgi:hypothetical protein